jgi:nickel/cobalt transporter (NiCoT) family protein
MGILAAPNLSKPGGGGIAGRKSGSPVAFMAVTIIGLHVVGWGVLVFTAVPQNLHISSTQVFGIGIGAGAYVLGMRHAFDADHIAAIDCTTRKLTGEGRRPLSVGFWFSLGHSSIVFGLCALLAAGAHYLGGVLGENASPLPDALGWAGTAISGVFLYILAAINVLILHRTVAEFRGARSGRRPGPLGAAPAGLMVRILRPVMQSIRSPWQMYVVGLLFGLGFDTATEVALLVVAVGAATTALPWYAILILPTLFAAGMCLFDTLDGWFMALAYGRALASPDRRLKYNVALTGLSAGAALSIGTVELMSLPSQGLDLTGLGYAVVGLFVLIWLVAFCAGRFHAGRKRSVEPGEPGRRISSAGPGDSQENRSYPV